MSVGTEGIPPILKTGERLAGLLATLLLVVVHYILWNSTGGLWRDEVTSATAVSRPSYVEMWQNNRDDSFPVYFGTVLRTWILVGFGDSDYALRGFGFAVSLAILAALWLNARELRIETPLLSLLLVACLPVTVRFGSAVRGYGLGLFWLLMYLWATLRILRELSLRNAIVYALLSLAAAHTYYTNCLMILAISIGAGISCLLTRSWKTLGVLVGSGLLSMCTMLIYLPTIQFHQGWSVIQKTNVSWSLLFKKFREALEFGWPKSVWVWSAATVATLFAALRVLSARRTRPVEERNLSLFAFITMIASLIGVFVYLKSLSVETAYWYYLPLLALCGVLIDAMVFLLVKNNVWARAARLVLFLIAATGLLIADTSLAQERMTSLDLVAETLTAQAEEKDLILVTHWQASITFDYYYHGKTRWMTVPELHSSRMQPYPEYKEKMTDPNALNSVLKAIEETLTSGGRVWLVDGSDPPFKPAPGLRWERPIPLPPAPHGPQKWEHPPYDYYWRNETLYFLLQHSENISPVDDWGRYHVFPAERLALHLFKGWKKGDAP